MKMLPLRLRRGRSKPGQAYRAWEFIRRLSCIVSKRETTEEKIVEYANVMAQQHHRSMFLRRLQMHGENSSTYPGSVGALNLNIHTMACRRAFNSNYQQQRRRQHYLALDSQVLHSDRRPSNVNSKKKFTHLYPCLNVFLELGATERALTDGRR